ncbi:MAG: BatA domain-containing protein [Thermoguttaceae bacterium]|jgi:hypothetical protein
MPTFLHPSLLWGLPIIGVPVLIHLINMMRHRRVDWAAMEFLLASQKKHRTWILLKQFLLLLVRMAAIAAIVLLVARPMLRHYWGSLLGGTKTHHVILLDDSFSMSDHWDDTTAFAEAKRVTQRIGAEAARHVQPQVFTLLPFSHARRRRSTQNDLINYRLGNDFAGKLAETLKNIEVSQTNAGPAEALHYLSQLLGEPEDERRILYVISDFRAKDWNDPADVRKLLQDWQTAESEKIRLVNCIDQARSNLAVAYLKPEEGIRAAGVPWFMDAAVTNFGNTSAKDVSLALVEDGHVRPSLIFSEIPPGKTVKQRFQVNFPSEGSHEITARLESDSVAADNYRFCTIDLPNDVPILIIDGDPQARDAQFLNWAAAPGGSVRTGLRPQLETPRFLGLKPLDSFAAVMLANVDRLDKSAIKALEQYAAAGGGVAFFLGEQCQSKFFNDELYRNGKGIFPLPLKGPAELPVDRLETAPDMQVEKHFIFRIFAERRNTFLQTVLVHRYFAVPEDWQLAPDSTVRVVARLRNGAPLVVEQAFGKGRAVAFLTTAAPAWNNWARNPSFVVVMQDLQAYLSQRDSAEGTRLVGEPLELSLDPAKYQAQVRFVAPLEGASPTASSDAAPNAEGKLFVALNETDAAGVYEARLTRTDNSVEIRRYAFNVDPAEGNLAALDKSQLAERLKGLKYEYEQASMFQSAADKTAGYDLSEVILYALVLLLLIEQILAWSVSYHPSVSRAASAAGGVR